MNKVGCLRERAAAARSFRCVSTSAASSAHNVLHFFCRRLSLANAAGRMPCAASPFVRAFVLCQPLRDALAEQWLDHCALGRVATLCRRVWRAAAPLWRRTRERRRCCDATHASAAELARAVAHYLAAHQSSEDASATTRDPAHGASLAAAQHQMFGLDGAPAVLRSITTQLSATNPDCMHVVETRRAADGRVLQRREFDNVRLPRCIGSGFLCTMR